MIFDKRKVYTAINADELNIGDIVYLADTVSRLKYLVREENWEYVSSISRIFCDEQKNRFADEDCFPYSLAYLVCPTRNVEAYYAWREGKKIEIEYTDPEDIGKSEWKLVESEEPDWYTFTYRPHTELNYYRPFNSIEELVVEFKEHFKVPVPDYAMPLIWVKTKSKDEKRLITGFTNLENGTQAVCFEGSCCSLGALFDYYEFLDNTPCGIEE